MHYLSFQVVCVWHTNVHAEREETEGGRDRKKERETEKCGQPRKKKKNMRIQVNCDTETR